MVDVSPTVDVITPEATTPSTSESETLPAAAPRSNPFAGVYVDVLSARDCTKRPAARACVHARRDTRRDCGSTNGDWLHVQYTPNPDQPPVSGWVRLGNVIVFADLDALNTVDTSDQPAATPIAGGVNTGLTAIVLPNRLNLRAGPGTNQTVLHSLKSGEGVQLLGRTEK